MPLADIQENDWDLSINRYKEIVYEEVQYDPPEEIIAAIKALDEERRNVLVNLEKMLELWIGIKLNLSYLIWIELS